MQFCSCKQYCSFIYSNDIFFLACKTYLNFLAHLFFSLKFFNTKHLIKTVAFGIRTQC